MRQLQVDTKQWTRSYLAPQRPGKTIHTIHTQKAKLTDTDSSDLWLWLHRGVQSLPDFLFSYKN